MESVQIEGIKSTAAIGGHPLHPIFIVFPVAFLVSLPFIDGLYLSTQNTCWAQVAVWVAGAGFILGLVAAVFGLADFLTINKARTPTGWAHALGNVAAMGITLANWMLRIDDPYRSVYPIGLTLSIITALVLMVTGWLGGELAYRYAIGVVGRQK